MVPQYRSVHWLGHWQVHCHSCWPKFLLMHNTSRFHVRSKYLYQLHPCQGLHSVAHHEQTQMYQHRTVVIFRVIDINITDIFATEIIVHQVHMSKIYMMMQQLCVKNQVEPCKRYLFLNAFYTNVLATNTTTNSQSETSTRSLTFTHSKN